MVLGNTGRNIGAGMTGGLAYFYMDGETGDEAFDESLLKSKMNMGSVSVRRVSSKGTCIHTQKRTILEVFDYANRVHANYCGRIKGKTNMSLLFFACDSGVYFCPHCSLAI